MDVDDLGYNAQERADDEELRRVFFEKLQELAVSCLIAGGLVMGLNATARLPAHHKVLAQLTVAGAWTYHLMGMANDIVQALDENQGD